MLARFGLYRQAYRVIFYNNVAGVAFLFERTLHNIIFLSNISIKPKSNNMRTDLRNYFQKMRNHIIVQGSTLIMPNIL